MEFAYEKLLAEHNLTVADLPAETRTGIKTIVDTMKLVALNEGAGKKINPSTWDKIKANDRWVVRDILDYLDDKDTNADTAPHSTEAIVKEIKAVEPEPAKQTPASSQVATSTQVDSKGLKIETEIEEIFKTGKTTLTLAELKSNAPTAYNVIFDSYTEGEQNGINTTKYSVLEGEKETFIITKK